MFSIKVDAATRLVETRIAGLLEPAEAAEYIASVRRAFVIHRLQPPYAMVIDISACPIQSQATVAAMREHIAEMPKARALAVVVGDSLARSQVRRLFTQPYARVVADQAEARAWALAGIEPASANVGRIPS